VTYIIAEPCIDIKDRSCVDVCPVDCIHEFERILIIDPEECIDCGACEPECPSRRSSRGRAAGQVERLRRDQLRVPDAAKINRSRVRLERRPNSWRRDNVLPRGRAR
jgi:NAD-dependent dihydropyrimidine dehydrogenase PreA subunit